MKQTPAEYSIPAVVLRDPRAPDKVPSTALALVAAAPPARPHASDRIRAFVKNFLTGAGVIIGVIILAFIGMGALLIVLSILTQIMN